MLLIVFTVALIAGTTQLSAIASLFISAPPGLRVLLGLALIACLFLPYGMATVVIPVDLHIRGCPPRPIDLLRGLIALMDGAKRRR
jgi:hypothetical protein